MIRVGVDAGGTFTDFVAVGPDFYRELKLRSRPDDPAAVVMEALDTLGLGHVELVFSTTAATNALLERRGGPTVLVTTAGFEDVLEIGRQARPQLYALEPVKPKPLVPAEARIGVHERVGVGGVVLTPLTDAEIDRVAALIPAGATVAICLLHAYASADHEKRIAARLHGHVSLSSAICPLPREYERTSTTVVDAYVQPVLGTTLGLLHRRVALRVMESSGGARAHASVRPARTVLSGPAAGVIAAEAIARARGLRHVVALDIGGTSTDVALIVDGRAARVDELAIDGLPIALPSVAVKAVGAGGGSIAWMDDGGALRVGPRSAAATPGPASYARGGSEPTVTDAHVVLGRIETLCGGEIVLDRAAAHAAIATLGDATTTARAIVAVAEATVARAIRSVALGTAPESITLVAYGGASGLHAVSVARALGITSLLVPAAPGLQCARGALGADVVVDEIASWQRSVDEALDERASILDVLANAADTALAADGVSRERRSLTRLVRARYVGQGIDGELELPADLRDRAAFDRAHEAAYGHWLDRAVEVVSLRVRGVGRADAITYTPSTVGGDPRIGTRVVDGREAVVYARARIAPGERVAGPAIIEELSSTTWLPKGASAVVEADGTLAVTTGVSSEDA